MVRVVSSFRVTFVEKCLVDLRLLIERDANPLLPFYYNQITLFEAEENDCFSSSKAVFARGEMRLASR